MPTRRDRAAPKAIGADGVPAFIYAGADAPTDAELRALLQPRITRLMKLLTRRGVLVEVERSTSATANDADWNEASDVCYAAGFGRGGSEA